MRGEERMARAGTRLRHTGSLAADWEGKPRRYLLCMRVPACVTLCCPASKTAAAAPWHLTETVCIDACARRINPSAIPEDVPPALLHYVG